jgi:hypothetical protein
VRGRARGLLRPPRLALALALGVLAAPAAGHATAVRIAIVGDEGCPPALRDRITEQIGDVADQVDLSCLSRFDAEEPFRSPDSAPDQLRIWVDVTPRTEARLTLRDGRADRFVVRRIPLPRGLDEIGREEIGQIVRSAAIAMLANPAETLSSAQARAEISRWEQPRAGPPAALAAPAGGAASVDERRGPDASGGPTRRLQVGPLISARTFATSIPIVEEIGIAAALGRPGALGAWIEAAYQIPARDDQSLVGVELNAFAFRAGLAASVVAGPSFVIHFGAGVGLIRTSFTPLGDPATVTTDPPSAFFSGAGRLLAGVDFRASKHVVAGVTLFCDVVGADVHYDLYEPDGSARRVLSPFRFQPGVALRIGWSP